MLWPGPGGLRDEPDDDDCDGDCGSCDDRDCEGRGEECSDPENCKDCPEHNCPARIE